MTGYVICSSGPSSLVKAYGDVTVGVVRYGNIHRTGNLDIAELLVVHGALGVVADVDVSNVVSYLKGKYGP